MPMVRFEQMPAEDVLISVPSTLATTPTTVCHLLLIPSNWGKHYQPTFLSSTGQWIPTAAAEPSLQFIIHLITRNVAVTWNPWQAHSIKGREHLSWEVQHCITIDEEILYEDRAIKAALLSENMKIISFWSPSVW
jgi:hypothetical protein